MAANLRKLARGRDCQVRIPGVCNRDPSTTVLAHIRLPGVSGVGMKVPDLLGAWACSACHDVIDGRVKAFEGAETLRLYHLEGMARTISELLKEGHTL